MARDITDETDETPAATSATRAEAQKEYWERVRLDILEAMKALPLREFGPKELPLGERAYILCNMAGFMLMNRAERANLTRKKDGVIKEAEAIRNAAAKLHALLEAAHGDTLTALERAEETDPQTGPPHMHVLAVSSYVRQVANLAHVAMLDAPSQPAKSGNKEKRAAAQVADLALRSFEDLTGRNASRTWDAYQEVERGAFMDFLSAVFKALGMKDSPRSQAKDAIGRRAGVNPPKD